MVQHVGVVVIRAMLGRRAHEGRVGEEEVTMATSKSNTKAGRVRSLWRQRCSQKEGELRPCAVERLGTLAIADDPRTKIARVHMAPYLGCKVQAHECAG